MTPTAFRAALRTLGWSASHLAARLGCERTTPGDWARGDLPVPAAIAEWLTALVAAQAAHPVPEWRQRRRAA